MIKKLKAKLDIHTLEVIKNSSYSLIIKLVGLILFFLISVFLGRILGASGLGVINLANQLIALMLVFSLIGMPQVIVKEVSVAFNNKNWKYIGNIMNTSYILNGSISIIISLIIVLNAQWISEVLFDEPRLKYPLLIGAMAMTPQLFSRIFSSGLIGFNKIWQSQLVDQALSMLIIAFALLCLWLLNYNISIYLVAIIYAIGRICVVLSVGIYWKKLFTKKDKRTFIGKDLSVMSLPLLIVSASLIISQNIDVVMLGALSDSKQIGFYSVASKLALMTSIILQISIASVAPKIAVLYNSNKKIELEKMIQRLSKGFAIIGLLSLLFFIILGNTILKIWGIEFVNAYWPLVILSIGQFFNMASGPIGNVLIMTNHGKALRNITMFTVTLNIILNFFLINYYQAIGASIATAVTIIINMLLCTYYTKRKVGITTFSYGVFKIKKN